MANKGQITRGLTRRIMRVVNRYYIPPTDNRKGVVTYAGGATSIGEEVPYNFIEGPHVDIGIVGLSVTIGVKQPLVAGFNAGQQTFSNFVIEGGAAEPGAPVDGQLFWNTTTQVLKLYSTIAGAWLVIGPTVGGGLSKSAWTAAPANQYTTISLGVIIDNGDDHIIIISGRTDAGDPPRQLSAGRNDNVQGEIFWTWYKDPADNTLYVRVWNGLEDLELRVFYNP